MNLKKSPLAPKSFPQMPAIDGVNLWTAETGAKYENRPDVLLIGLEDGSAVAGVFTKSSAPGAPIPWSKDRLENGASGGILITSGNANVFTGAQGERDVQAMADYAASALGLRAEDIYICSTGVIGEPMDLEPLSKTFAQNSFMNTQASWEQAAQAICTTDTFSKGAYEAASIDGADVSICGIVKGSGMIMPDMATMLGFIFTDANIGQPVLQALLSGYCETSFNAITVDSDTSTSDTVLLAASGRAGHELITAIDDPRLSDFKIALKSVMLSLALQVVRDGEGASKFIQVQVTGAATKTDAKTIAMSIANSPLVKTAIAGADANWGRVVMAIGKSGARASRDDLSIWFGDHIVAKNGARAASYDEDVLSAYMQNARIDIRADVGIGAASFTVWTCDLTHGYIDINADYRS